MHVKSFEINQNLDLKNSELTSTINAIPLLTLSAKVQNYIS